MDTLSETFKNCNTIQTDKHCPICNAILNQKRLKIDNLSFKGLKKFGITHKAVNFCLNPECPFLEQGIIYLRESSEEFLCLKEIDALMEKFSIQ